MNRDLLKFVVSFVVFPFLKQKQNTRETIKQTNTETTDISRCLHFFSVRSGNFGFEHANFPYSRFRKRNIMESTNNEKGLNRRIMKKKYSAKEPINCKCLIDRERISCKSESSLLLKMCFYYISSTIPNGFIFFAIFPMWAKVCECLSRNVRVMLSHHFMLYKVLRIQWLCHIFLPHANFR